MIFIRSLDVLLKQKKKKKKEDWNNEWVDIYVVVDIWIVPIVEEGFFVDFLSFLCSVG